MGRNLKKWLESTKEEAIDPEQVIIDAHHHLWDPINEPRVTSGVAKLFRFLPYGMQQTIFRSAFPKATLYWFSEYSHVATRYSLSDMQKDFHGHNVVGTVAIESGYHEKGVAAELANLGETKAIAKMSKDLKFPVAIAPFIDLTLPKENVEKGIAAHKSASEDFASIRHQIASYTDNAENVSPTVNKKMVYGAAEAAENDLSVGNEVFINNLKLLAEEGINYEAWAYFYQIPQVMDIAKAVPNLSIVLNHMGTRMGDKIFPDQKSMNEAWEKYMKELSECSNVTVKLSGFLMPGTGVGQFHLRKKAPSSDEILEVFYPLFEKVLDWFGVDRCFFASNFPVDKASCSYVVLWNGFKKACNKKGLSKDEKDKLFFVNAAKLYNLESKI
eukprot:snap_masked-scaffold_36-processed-gene-0.22-mRNA-1 protein AED:1.00 eAED:1.00 QI:0/-1/0/0/-1/1/1/0/385